MGQTEPFPWPIYFYWCLAAMNLRYRIKNKLIANKVPLFLFRKKIVLTEIILASIVFLLICSYYEGAAVFHFEDFLFSLVCTIVLYAFFVYRHIKDCPYLKKGDAINGNVTADVILTSSSGIGTWRLQSTVNWISSFLAYEGACYQKCVFGKLDDFAEKDYFYYVLTKRRAEILTKLYSGEIKYWDYGMYPQGLKFFSGIPLRVVYKGKNHFLKQLLPVDGYQYSPEELELIRSFNESDRLGKKTIERRAFVTYCGVLFCLLPLTFGISLLGVLFLNFLLALVFNFGSIVSYVPWIALIVLLYLLTFYGTPVWTGSYKRDENLRDYVTEDVKIMLIGLPLNSVTGNYIYIFREEHAKCYECRCVVIDSRSTIRKGYEERLYFIMTKEKAALLRILADIDIHFNVYVMNNALHFNSCLPIRVTYGKRSHVLKSIAPAENYEYTEAQLAAIEKFNTLYP